MQNLENKVAVITGAAAGIGRALALQLAAEGVKLALVDIDENTLSQTTEEVRKCGVEVFSSPLDVSDRDAVFRMAESVHDHFGAVHIVINNAGVVLERAGVLDLPYEDFEKVMAVNFWGVVHGTQAYLPYLLEEDEASLVNISSVYGLAANPNHIAYSTSKFAVRGFTEAVRQELRDTQVAATVVFPGLVVTDLKKNEIPLSKTSSYVETGKEKEPPFDVKGGTPADKAASEIINAIKNKLTRLLIGKDAQFLDVVTRKSPGMYGAIIKQRKKGEKT